MDDFEGRVQECNKNKATETNIEIENINYSLQMQSISETTNTIAGEKEENIEKAEKLKEKGNEEFRSKSFII